MAQSGYTPILIYASGTASAVPSAANLTSSANGAELALNYADGKLYYKNSSGVVKLLAPVPGGISYVTKTSNYTTQDNEGVLANTAGGSFTVTLPATPATGAQVVVADPTGNWGTNNLTIGRNGSTIAGFAQDLLCNINGVSVQLVYSGTTWTVYAQVGGNTGLVSVSNGGTGATTLTANNVILGNGTSAVQFVAPGTNGNVLTSNGTTWTSAAASVSNGLFVSQQIFTSSGTWTKPAGVTKVRVRGVGGGGAGGGVRASVAATGSGGGGGGYFEEIIDVSAVSTVTVTIGAGGTGVSANNGNAGGTTSFGAFASGNGGAGGALENGGGGAGGSATGGDINITGQYGSIGAGGSNFPGGLGGSSMLGLGGGMISEDQTGTGKAATGYGAGGGGSATAAAGGGTAASTGGAGSAGIVIVEEYS